MEFEGLNGHEVYAQVAAAVLQPNHALKRTVRGYETRDLGYTSIIILNASQPILPLGTRPGIGTKLAAVEAAQLVAGISAPDVISQVAPALDRFKEDGGEFHGAYGTRVGDQVSHIVNKIKADEGTRQAVITLWDPVLDNQPGKRDFPCTIGMQFSVSAGELHLNVIMRSNDIWLGLPYDMFQFTQLQRSVARSLNLRPGWYRHTAWSMHAYESDIEKLDSVDYRRRANDPEPDGFGHDYDSWETIKERALQILHPPFPSAPTRSELWYMERFYPSYTMDLRSLFDTPPAR